MLNLFKEHLEIILVPLSYIIISLVQGVGFLSSYIVITYFVFLSFLFYKSIHRDNIIYITWISFFLILLSSTSDLYYKMIFFLLIPFIFFIRNKNIKNLRYFRRFTFIEIIISFTAIILLFLKQNQLAIHFILMSILIRHVQFPTNLWLKEMRLKQELFPSFVYYLLSQSGLIIYANKEVLSLSSHYVTLFITFLTVFTGFYLAFAALKERNFLVKHLKLITSQLCLPLAAFHAHDTTSETGGVLFALVLSFAGGTSSLIAFHLYIQKKIETMNRFYSLYASNKNLAVVYIISILSIVGLPFTLGYVAEDILFHGLIKTNPFLGGVYVLMTAINGFTAFSMFNHYFFGHSQYRSSTIYLTRLNKLFIFMALFFILIGGLGAGILAPEIEKRLDITSKVSFKPVQHMAYSKLSYFSKCH